MRRINKLLVANRGEIACRIMRTCRAMGIATVAVYSDADADAVHVEQADEAVRIGAAPSADSYLRIDRILEAAARTGADAVHPGYGFLAENAAFADQVVAAGLIFVGPSAAAIRSMGSKREAKRVAEAAGVPIVQGYSGDEQSTEALVRHAEAVGLPVLIKASAGGGGKGMRIVRTSDALAEAIDRGRSEAKRAFGDDTLLIERYVDRPRHIEIQIFGDAQGNMVHLFERECSIQRRHQKIIEETPSTAVDADLRDRMASAATSIGRAIGYDNAGTVEFILAPDGAFYFLEVNTRLQVEHPVTELVTGVDLVREQIRVAEGRALSFTQDELRQSGAAIEVRLYAEDPRRDFLPMSGQLLDWRVDDGEGSALRVDAGVRAGSEVGIHYDPMLAKVIAHAPTREEAIRLLTRGLGRLCAPGLVLNRALLLAVLGHEAFAAGDIDTHFLDRHLDALNADAAGAEQHRAAAVAVTLAQHAQRRRHAPLPGVLSGYRNNRVRDQWAEQQIGEAVVRVEYRVLDGSRLQVTVGDPSDQDPAEGWTAEARDLDWTAPYLRFELDGLRRTVHIVFDGPRFFVHADQLTIQGRTCPRFPEAATDEGAAGCVAPMPGKVIELRVEVGQAVHKGQTLAVLEAMKMEHSVGAPYDGTVEAVRVGVADQVDEGAVLVVVTEAED